MPRYNDEDDEEQQQDDYGQEEQDEQQESYDHQRDDEDDQDDGAGYRGHRAPAAQRPQYNNNSSGGGHKTSSGYGSRDGTSYGGGGGGGGAHMRRALFIGINYTYTEYPLAGCHKDVENMLAFFHARFPDVQEVMVLTDEDGAAPESMPTKDNLLAAMRWLVADARPGDHFFFHYSGHGGQAKDDNGDEEDGMDETVMPLDFQENGEIHDDDLYDILARPLPKGSFLTAIFDCCHSGTMMDLPYTYLLNQNNEVVRVNNFEAAGHKLMQGGLMWLTGDKQGAMAMAMEGFKLFASGRHGRDDDDEGRDAGGEEGLAETSGKKKETQGTVIQWSGCKDDQTSADTKIGNMPTGAMSWAFIKSINENPHGSYLDALKRIRELLRDEYTQIPQLSCGYAMDLDQPMGF